MIKKLTGLTASLVALASAAHAEVKINDNLALSGFAVGALTSSDTDSGGTTSTALDSGVTNFDAVKVALTGKYDELSGKVSLFYVPESTSGASEAGLLDAYLTYSAGAVSFTGGKFLSYLGYEAWDAINMTTVSYGNSWAFIPGYHSGAKVDFAGEGFALGAAVTDSLYMDPLHFFGGDGDFSDGLGYEGYVSYTGIEKVTLFAGVGVEDADGVDTGYVFDFWASYALTDAFSVAGEYSYVDDGTDEASVWALFGTYVFSDAVAVTGRVSGALDSLVTDESGTAFTIAPTYTINENFAVRAEVTYADSMESAVQMPGDKGFFYAVQGIFKF
jgi:hypothetical protein